MQPSFFDIDFIQNAYCVNDLDAACERLNQTMGLGPFLGGSEAELKQHHYHGKLADPIRIRSVFTQAGTTLIELIEVLSNAPSAFHDMLPEDDEPFAFLHHAAFFAKDYHAERDQFAAAGCPIISEFAFDNAHVCYADTRAQLGHFVEIYPEHPVIRSMYAQTKAARQDRPGAMVLEHFQF